MLAILSPIFVMDTKRTFVFYFASLLNKKHLGYVTCKFSTRVEIHSELNSALPMVKVLFVVTCWNELKFQPYGYLSPVLEGRYMETSWNSAQAEISYPGLNFFRLQEHFNQCWKQE